MKDIIGIRNGTNSLVKYLDIDQNSSALSRRCSIRDDSTSWPNGKWRFWNIKYLNLLVWDTQGSYTDYYVSNGRNDCDGSLSYLKRGSKNPAVRWPLDNIGINDTNNKPYRTYFVGIQYSISVIRSCFFVQLYLLSCALYSNKLDTAKDLVIRVNVHTGFKIRNGCWIARIEGTFWNQSYRTDKEKNVVY